MLNIQPRGGTEILLANLHKWVPKKYLDKINLITSTCDPRLLSNSKPNVVWQHVNTDQRVVEGMTDKNFVSKVQKFVYVSDWQRIKFHMTFPMLLEKSHVIKNAIEPIPWIEKRKDGKLKLIYTSTPWRGLHLLVESFRLLNRQDIELDVYSSTVIYGSNFMKNDYKWLYHLCKTTPGINYKGYALNKGVRKALQEAHLFAYPSIFEETSCLAAIEAGAAGCSLVLTDLGALPETCEAWASYSPYTNDFKYLVENYSKLLTKKIDNYWDQYDLFKNQSTHFNNKYSWYHRKDEWINLIEKLTN